MNEEKGPRQGLAGFHSKNSVKSERKVSSRRVDGKDGDNKNSVLTMLYLRCILDIQFRCRVGNWIWKSGKRSGQDRINVGALNVEVTKATGLGMSIEKTKRPRLEP